MPPITILLAEDQEILRELLRCKLEEHANFRIVAEAGDGLAAVRLTQELLPDIALIDIMMPELDGIEATRRIVAQVPGCKVIALSAYSSKESIDNMRQAGAVGYLTKDMSVHDVETAIEKVIAGGTYFNPEIVDRSSYGDPSLASLTEKERAVLRLLAEGYSSPQIAAELGIERRTVEGHRQKIMDKLGIHNAAALASYAIRMGIH